MNDSTSHDRRYLLLLGQGRSGTNFLLSLLNQGEGTHCRNEPDQCEGSALWALRPFRFFVDDHEALARTWGPSFATAAASFGPRDHVVLDEKTWIRRGRRGLGYQWLRWRYRIAHRLLKGPAPIDAPEVRFPAWMVDHGALAESMHVFKLNAAVGLATWAFRERPGARAVHIVRHPGGFAKSWQRRWVEGKTHQGRAQGNKDFLLDEERLRELARRDATWAARMGDIEAMSRMEAELWWWRFVNEHTYEVGRDRPSYRRVLFEELAEDPIGVSREVFRFADLDFPSEVEGRIRTIARGAKKIARAWRDELAPEVIETIDRVLDGSPMQAWWPEESGPERAAG